MLGHATIRLYGDLTDIAWDADRGGEVHVPVDRPRSVKDAVESCGVPHTEIDLVLVNGGSVGFTEAVGPGDRVAVYPPFVELDVPSRVRPPEIAPRFLLDVHLGRLARRLRVLGFDTAYRNDADDAELAAEAAADQRWLLTRDRGLLMRSVVTHGYLLRSLDPRLQVFEVVRRFQLTERVAPMTRCTNCNGLLRDVDKSAVEHLLEPATRREHDDFAQCSSCGQVYWAGSHHPELRRFVAEVAAAPD